MDSCCWLNTLWNRPLGIPISSKETHIRFCEPQLIPQLNALFLKVPKTRLVATQTFFKISPRSLGKWSTLTCAYLSGWSHQLEKTSWPGDYPLVEGHDSPLKGSLKNHSQKGHQQNRQGPCFFFSLHFWVWKKDQVDSHPPWCRLALGETSHRPPKICGAETTPAGQRFPPLKRREQLGMLWMFLAQVDSFGFWLQFAANSSSRSHKLRTESCRSNRQIELGLVLLQSICLSFCSCLVEFLGTLEMQIWSTVSLADQMRLWLTKYIGVMPSKMIPLMVQKSQNNHLGCVKPCK